MDDKDVVIRKISGKFNPANSLTKYTPAHESQRDMAYIMNAQTVVPAAGYQGFAQQDEEHVGIRHMVREAAERPKGE